jgi:hypothetical protein
MTAENAAVTVQENRLVGDLPARWVQLQEHEADVDAPAVNYARV